MSTYETPFGVDPCKGLTDSRKTRDLNSLKNNKRQFQRGRRNTALGAARTGHTANLHAQHIESYFRAFYFRFYSSR